MDIFTHFVVPYLVLFALRRPQRERLAAGIGGWAPDSDVVTSALFLLDERLYYFGHRGVSHSLIGAPFYALAVAAILTIPWWGNKWPKLQALRFTPAMLVLAMLASYTHLALDSITMWGVALGFPWSPARFAIDLYFYSAAWMIPVSFWFCWGLWKGRADDRFVRKWGAIVLVVLLVAGGARLAWKPPVPEGGRSIPVGNEWAWATIEPVEGGYQLQAWSFGKPGATERVDSTVPPEAATAVAQARDFVLAKRFLYYAGGPIATQAEARADGGWNVTFVDLMRIAQNVGRDSPFEHFARDFGTATFVVDDAGVRERE